MKLDIKKISKRKINNSEISIITIDGITCSGKSIFSKLLKKKLNNKFNNIYILPKDLFLFSRKHRIKIIKKIKNKLSNKQNYLHYDLKKLDKLIKVIAGKTNKKTLTLNYLYNRQSGKNNKKIKFYFKKNVLIIFEGLFLLDDLKRNNINPNIKILIIEKIYDSLARKIERIRDKKISIQHVVTEYTNIHLKSFNEYIKKYKFNYAFTDLKRKFVLINKGKEKQIKLINIFKNKHY